VGKWEMVRLSDVLYETITGEWGAECTNGEVGTKVLRTTNFTNSGIINFDNVVERIILETKIEKKKLKRYDIILEKSGGSDNQPVGRVVFFDNAIDDVYLCNNFTQILRINQSMAFPKYIFLFLFYLHKNGITELMQNKTTGIRNLQVKRYMALEIPLPPLQVQQQVADLLDRASALIEKRKAQIEKLDLLIKAQFIEMFGDPVTNPKGWEIRTLSDITTSRLGKMLDAKQQTGKSSFSYLANYNVQWFRFELSALNEMDFSEADQKEFELKKGDLLVCEGGEVGRCAIWNDEIPSCYFQKALHRVRCNKEIILPEYLARWFYNRAKYNRFKDIIGQATIAHLPGVKLKQLRIPVPSLTLQNKFADFFQQVEAQKSQLKKSLDKLELNYKSLMQKCFRGEIF